MATTILQSTPSFEKIVRKCSEHSTSIIIEIYSNDYNPTKSPSKSPTSEDIVGSPFHQFRTAGNIDPQNSSNRKKRKILYNTENPTVPPPTDAQLAAWANNVVKTPEPNPYKRPRGLFG